MEYEQLSSNRQFAGRLAHGQDILKEIKTLCDERFISAGYFSLIGAVSSLTYGFYDQKKKVYQKIQSPLPYEIVYCGGNISIKDDEPFVHAHIIAANEQGETMGGHLFSDTIVFAAEIIICELIDAPLIRQYDKTTGLMLWNGTLKV